MNPETPDPRPGLHPPGAGPGVETFGVLPVMDLARHERWCKGWTMTRLVQRRTLAICPGCGCAVRVPAPV